jgi:Tol biopolymer transport system component
MRLYERVLPLVVVAVVATAAAGPADAAGRVRTTRVSVSSAGEQGDGLSYENTNSAVSADGRFVAFYTISALAGGDTNGRYDIYVRDRGRKRTSRVSISTAGAEANDNSYNPSVSADGRFVAFESVATNLVANDANAFDDVFVRDRKKHTTRLVSKNVAGVSANFHSMQPAISADGRFVAFASYASDLVPNDTNNHSDVFVRDMKRGKTIRVSLSSGGAQANANSTNAAVSADGRFVAFASDASNLVRGDANTWGDVFVRDRRTGKTLRVSVSTSGLEGNDVSTSPSISANGRFVAFTSSATDLVRRDTNGYEDVFVRDLAGRTTARLSVSSRDRQGNNDSLEPAISGGGRFVAFASYATNLTRADGPSVDVFVRDRATGRTSLVSRNSSGTPGDDFSDFPSIAGDGSFVVFESGATNLVPGDTNATIDVFVRGPLT